MKMVKASVLWNQCREYLGFAPLEKVVPVASSPQALSAFDDEDENIQPDGDLSASHLCNGLKGLCDEVQIIRWADQERLVLTKASPMTQADHESISRFAQKILGSAWQHRVYLLDGFSLAVERIPALNFHPAPTSAAVHSHDIGGEG
jgi:hypothetical protein